MYIYIYMSNNNRSFPRVKSAQYTTQRIECTH